MTFAAKQGGVSTSRPKAVRLRDPPPRDVFGSFPNGPRNLIAAETETIWTDKWTRVVKFEHGARKKKKRNCVLIMFFMVVNGKQN